MRYAAVLGILGIVLASSAMATVVPEETPQPGELNVWEIYNNLYGTTYANNADLYDDRAVDMSTWDTPVSSVVGYIEARVAYAYVDSEFGWYATSAPGTLNPLFDVSDSGPISNTAVIPYDDAFGLYLFPDGGGAAWYSEAGLNWLNEDHLVVYETPDPMDATVLLAWEDLPWFDGEGAVPGSDNDYNDLVIELSWRCEQEIVPEPATMMLLGLGIAGIAVRRFVVA